MTSRQRILRIVVALVILAALWMFISRCQRAISNLSLGPLVAISGSIERIGEVEAELEIRLAGDSRLFRSKSSYPQTFDRSPFDFPALKPGDPVTIRVQKSDLDELSERTRWLWLSIVALESDDVVFLTPEKHIEWDRENRATGLNLLWGIFAGVGLWLMSLCVPSSKEPIVDGVKWLFTLWSSAYGWLLALGLIVVSIPAAFDCWTDWQMRDSPTVSGEVVERKDVKRYLIMKRQALKIRPDGHDILVETDAYSSTPDRLKFRWDGASEEIYLRGELGNPWKNLALLLGFGCLAIIMALFLGWAMRQEEFWS